MNKILNHILIGAMIIKKAAFIDVPVLTGEGKKWSGGIGLANGTSRIILRRTRRFIFGEWAKKVFH